jgi:outer membrane protein assembly factor BamB
MADWSRFRGPNGSGIGSGTIPAEFSPTKNVIWKTALPPGYSSPILAGDHIVVTAYEGSNLQTISINRASGKIEWRRQAPRPRAEKLDNRNGPASPSAAIDGNSIFVFFGDYGMISYGLDGNERWRAPLGPFNNVYGMGSSPVVVGNTVVLICDQSSDSFAIGIDKTTGKVKWKKARPEALSGHSTPAVYGNQVIAPASFRVDSYDADTGEIVWFAHGLASEMKSVPIVDGDMVYISGYNTPDNDPGKQVKLPDYADVLASNDRNKDGLISPDESPDERTRKYFPYIDLNGDGKLDANEWKMFQLTMSAENGLLAFDLRGAKGDVTQSALRWKYQRSVPQLPSVVAYRGVVYMVNDSGILTTIDQATGKALKTARVRGAADSYYASPVAADGKVIFISRNGKVTVLKAGPEQEQIAASEMDDDVVATPAVVDGRIYVRTKSALYCFGEKGQWSQYRGPNGSGVAAGSANPPEELDPAKASWKTEIPAGYSSPIVGGGRVFVTAHIKDRLFTIALDRFSGKELWRAEAPNVHHQKANGPNSPASPSPVTDGENVYSFFGDFGLISYTAEGRERWRYALPAFNNPYNPGGSPVLSANTLLLIGDQDTDAFLLAIDTATGKQLWKRPRPGVTHSFSTPIVYEPSNGPAQVLVSGSFRLTSYSVATGEPLWWVSGMAWQAKTHPVIEGDTVFVHSWMASMDEIGSPMFRQTWAETLAENDKNKDGKLSPDEIPAAAMKPLFFLFDLNKDGFLDQAEWDAQRDRNGAENGVYAIKMTGRGDITKSAVLWRYNKGLGNLPSPLLYQGVLYLLKEGGILTALDPKTGEVLKQGRVDGAIDAYAASPIAAAGRIYLASKKGKLAVLSAGADWKVLNVHDTQEEIWGTPAIAGNSIYVRTDNAVYCFERSAS